MTKALLCLLPLFTGGHPASAPKTSITSIVLKFDPGYVRVRQSFGIELKANGSATMWKEGQENGVFRATGFSKEFARLARELTKGGFSKQPGFYGLRATDLPETTLQVLSRSGSKTVSYQGGPSFGGGDPKVVRPPKWIFDFADEVRRLGESRRWKKVSDKSAWPNFSEAVRIRKDREGGRAR